jgi:hypothetical protein
MKAELGNQIRVAGLARSPDREGALSHLDADRGFALVARGSISLTDVIDPTIWVREKLVVALATGADPQELPLKKLIAALRSIHGDLMRRSEGDRPWVSVLAVLFHGGDGVALSAGNCPCFRYRDGLLSRLKRGGDEEGTGMPRGALGSEPQVRIEVVPLRPRAGDLYVLSTRPLREGELAAMARDLSSARDGAQLLRAGVEGARDRGRLAIRVLDTEEDATLPARAESLQIDEAPGVETFEEEGAASLEIAPLLPDDVTIEIEPERAEGPEGAIEVTPPSVPPGVPGAVAGMAPPAGAAEPEPPTGPGAVAGPSWAEEIEGGQRGGWDLDRAGGDRAGGDRAGGDRTPSRVPPRSVSLAPVDEERPWYEPLALWGGGALAFIALALLVRAILPGLLGTRGDQSRPPAIAAPTSGTVDFLSDPPGAAVRVNGVPLEGRTPLAGVAIDAGMHRIELDWGAAGVWRDTLEVAVGSRLVVHPAIFGGLSFRSSDPSRVLDVFLDGSYVGTTPLRLERVVVGRHLVRFGGPGMSTTAQEVEVLRDTPVELVGSAGPLPQSGRLTVRSALLTDVGFEASRNEPVWVDGVARGATPVTLDLKPGAHSVRVVRRGFPAQVTILDVKAGGEHFVTAEFGARSEEPLRFAAPTSFSLKNPSPVIIALPESEWDPSMTLWLYAAAPGGSFQAKRMTRLEDGERTFAALLPAEVVRNTARQVRFYFKAAGTAGRELYSEIYTVPVRD